LSVLCKKIGKAVARRDEYKYLCVNGVLVHIMEKRYCQKDNAVKKLILIKTGRVNLKRGYCSFVASYKQLVLVAPLFSKRGFLLLFCELSENEFAIIAKVPAKRDSRLVSFFFECWLRPSIAVKLEMFQ
jgi:hypothetical protein